MTKRKDRFKITPAVHLLLIKEKQVLLQKRKDTGYMDGWYGLPSGHLDGNEKATYGLIREAHEEIGVKITPACLDLKLTMHRMAGDTEYLDWFFISDSWIGEIQNKEPNKCSALSFFLMNDLPDSTIPYIINAIECISKGETFVEYGW